MDSRNLSAPAGRTQTDAPATQDADQGAQDFGQSASRTKAATSLQAAWRGRQVRGPANAHGYREIHHFGDRGKGGEPVGFSKASRYLPMPDRPATNASGNDWTLTHETSPKRSKRFVALKQNATARYPGQAMADDVRQALTGLDHVLLPHHVRPNLKIADRMEEDAFDALQRGPMPIASFAGALRGLKALHERGLIHRDIKPENMLMKDGEAYIADLDGVGFNDRLENEGVFTPNYMGGDACAAAANGQNALLAHQAEYGKVSDDRAMVQSLILATHPDPSAVMDIFAKAQKFAWYVRSQPATDDVGLQRSRAALVTKHTQRLQPWIDQHVREEFRPHVALLLQSPVQYQQTYGSGLHLADMVRTDQG